MLVEVPVRMGSQRGYRLVQPLSMGMQPVCMGCSLDASGCSHWSQAAAHSSIWCSSAFSDTNALPWLVGSSGPGTGLPLASSSARTAPTSVDMSAPSGSDPSASASRPFATAAKVSASGSSPSSPTSPSRTRLATLACIAQSLSCAARTISIRHCTRTLGSVKRVSSGMPRRNLLQR